MQHGPTAAMQTLDFLSPELLWLCNSPALNSTVNIQEVIWQQASNRLKSCNTAVVRKDVISSFSHFAR